jgi:hypothetical protein
MEPLDWVKFLLDLGLSGVLLVGIWQFIKGNIVSKTTHDEALEIERKASERFAEIQSKEICEKIAEGVQKGIAQGIADGYLSINGGDGG